jgi:hypothetical protein
MQTESSVEARAPVKSSRAGWSSPAALLRIGLSNLPFVLALVVIQQLPAFLTTLVVGGILFLSPGLAWVDRRGADTFVVLFRAVIFSLLAALLTWLAMLALPGPTSRVGFILMLAAITNLGLLRGFRNGYYEGGPRFTRLTLLATAVAAAFFLQTFVGVAYRVPPLEDHDMETQGTSYGLINDFVPTMVTNRHKVHFFAHPLLLHFYIGASALVSDDLERLHYYHESSLAVQAGADLIRRWQQDLAHFERDPVLLATRTPNLFFATFTLFPLAFLVFRICGSRAAAAGSCVIYMTLPEIYVRSAYGGYMAITNFLTLSGAYFYLQSSGLFPYTEAGADDAADARRRAASTAFIGAWSNQKSILIAMATATHAGLCFVLERGTAVFSELWRRARAKPEVVTAFAIGVCFVAGWATYALYGLSVAPQDFFNDHIKSHVAGRLRLRDVNVTEARQGEWVYPSIVALWRQFSAHTGWVIVGAALLGAARAAKHFKKAEGLFLSWLAIGAVGFSLVDWRQTKHLSKIVPPLVVLIGLLWASLDKRTRTAFTLVLAGAVLWNVWTISRLMADFNYLKPLPIW